tara:strand:+ start:127 stop:567 length:441 start_codon:yes stop_codon:yes gene_type:complete
MSVAFGAIGALVHKRRKERLDAGRQTAYYHEARASGIGAFDLKGLRDFSQRKTTEKISQEQTAYQKQRELSNEALSNPVAPLAKKPKTVSSALDSGPADTSNIRNSSPLAPPANTQGDAKPLFGEEFERKASMLAGSLDQANRVGY